MGAAERLVKAAPAARLPLARPGARCRGASYFEDATQRMPLGMTDVTIVLAHDAASARPVASVHWDGRQIGWMDGLRDIPYAAVLHRHGSPDQVFTATAEIAEQTGRGLDSAVRTIRVLVPAPEKLDDWFRAEPADRESLALDTVTATAAIKESEQHQEALRSLRQRHGHRTFRATVELGSETSGRQQGEEFLTFRAGRQVVGRIPARYREQHYDVFAAARAGVESCDVVIRASRFAGGALYATATIRT